MACQSMKFSVTILNFTSPLSNNTLQYTSFICSPRAVKMCRYVCGLSSHPISYFPIKEAAVNLATNNIQLTKICANGYSKTRNAAFKIGTKQWFQSNGAHESKRNVKRRTLCEILQCTDEELENLNAENSVIFRKVKPIVVLQTLQFLEDNGVHVKGEYLRNNLWLLNIYPIEETFEIIKSLFPQNHVKADYLPLLMVNKRHIFHALKMWTADSDILQVASPPPIYFAL